MKNSSAKNYPTSLGNPVDAVAKRVTGKGYQYTPDLKIIREIWEAPPPCQPMPTTQLNHNLIGTRQHKLEIVSYYKFYTKPNGKHKHLYLVRCDCGKYETRDGYIWRKFKDFNGQCQFCNHAWQLKHRHLTGEEKRQKLQEMKRNFKPIIK